MSTVRVPLPAAPVFDLLDEPLLIFGGPTAARDPKAGLSLAGPAGLDPVANPRTAPRNREKNHYCGERCPRRDVHGA